MSLPLTNEEHEKCEFVIALAIADLYSKGRKKIAVDRIYKTKLHENGNPFVHHMWENCYNYLKQYATTHDISDTKYTTLESLVKGHLRKGI